MHDGDRQGVNASERDDYQRQPDCSCARWQIWTHWDLNPGPSACEADVIPLHHVPNEAACERAATEEVAALDFCKPHPDDVSEKVCARQDAIKYAQAARQRCKMVTILATSTAGLARALRTRGPRCSLRNHFLKTVQARLSIVELQTTNMVPRGLEPRTLRLLAVRSNQLSYETNRA